MSSIAARIVLKKPVVVNRVRTKGLKDKSIRITVKGYLASDGLYSKWTGDAYELAEIHAYGLHGPKRPFLANIRKQFSENGAQVKKLADKIKSNTKFYKRSGEWKVRWDKVGDWVVSQSRSLMKGGKLGLVPLKASTARRKSRAGYKNGPLYASGGLADCIAWEMV